jgi:hypothetical protein
MKNITWKKVLLEKDITAIEDPITGSEYCKHYYYSIYGKVLDELDGKDEISYVDFFFERHPIRPFCLVFIGENEKFDFMDWARDFNIIPSMKQIQDGETDKDVETKIEREKKHKENILRQQQLISDNKEKLDPFQIELTKILNIFNTCQNLASQGEKKIEKLKKANNYLSSCWKTFYSQHENNFNEIKKNNTELQKLIIYIQK